MYHQGNAQTRIGRRKQIVLAMGIALGLATTQSLAGPSGATVSQRYNDGPAAALIRHAAEAGIAVPADLPLYMERLAKQKAKKPPATPKATIQVTNCNNSGSGSLRAAVGFASSGDVVDMSGLNCNITLTSSIVTSVNNLTLKGNPDNKYGISGGNSIRPLNHTGTGQLTLDGVIVRHGRVTSNSASLRGGCVLSQGSVELTNQAQVKYCELRNTATTGSPVTEGGAIFAADTVTIVDGGRVANSTATSLTGTVQGGGIRAPFVNLSGGLIELNTARITGDGTFASGGGIHADSIMGKYSVVRRNNVVVSGSASAVSALAGGIEITGDGSSAIKYSTLNNNTVNAEGASFGGGAAIVFGTSSQTGDFEMKSSTIANNSTSNSTKYGGAMSLRKNATIRSSTISGNTEKNAGDNKYGAGITLNDGVTLTMTSSIIGGNHLISSAGGGTQLMSDLGLQSPGNDSATVVGTQNFRNWIDSDITWPAGNIGGLNSVRLGSLRDNGGLTQTMMPNADSPVIDEGGTTGLTGGVDQRGEGFPRVIGTQADIGAVEWRLVPEIFEDGFESD